MTLSKATPEVKAAIVESVRNGAFPKHAAEAAGISKTTYHEWCNADADFAARVAQAKAEALNESAQVIRGSDDWRARAWWAERMSPEFNLAAKVELSGADGGPVQVASVPLSPADLAAAARALVKVSE